MLSAGIRLRGAVAPGRGAFIFKPCRTGGSASIASAAPCSISEKAGTLRPLPSCVERSPPLCRLFYGTGSGARTTPSGLYLDAPVWHAGCSGADRSWWTWQNADDCGVCLSLSQALSNRSLGQGRDRGRSTHALQERGGTSRTPRSALAEPFLPRAGAGHLLFTTRAQALGGLAQRLDIQKMEQRVGALLLLRRADIIARPAVLDTANPDERSVACAISEELDGLPLALDQAGAYIKEAPCPLPEYLPRYQTRRSEILRARGRFDQDYPASVATTWSLSFEIVREAHPASADLLNFCAFLAPDAIPEMIIAKGAAHLPPTLREAVVHPLQFDQTVSAALAYSLLHRNPNATLDIHRLVQAVLRDNIPVKKPPLQRGVRRALHRPPVMTQKDWKQRAVLAVGTTFPKVEVAHWAACEGWLPHALVCATWIEQEQIVSQEAARLLSDTASYSHDRARYTEAEPLCVRARSIREEQLGATHPDTANSLNNLALLLKTQGKHAEAESLYRRALAIMVRRLGTDHPQTQVIRENYDDLLRISERDRDPPEQFQAGFLFSQPHSDAEHL